MAAMDSAAGYGTPLNQLGQGPPNLPWMNSALDLWRTQGPLSGLQSPNSNYGGDPSLGYPQGADAAAGPSATATGIGGTAQGAPGVSPGGPTGPSGSVNVGAGQLSGPQYGGAAGDDSSAPGGGAGPVPAGGGASPSWPWQVAQAPTMTTSGTAPGGGFNASSFGSLGTAFAGQRPGIGARYWARLNNIGGT
jgi:hypothetical protein